MNSPVRVPFPTDDPDLKPGDIPDLDPEEPEPDFEPDGLPSREPEVEPVPM